MSNAIPGYTNAKCKLASSTCGQQLPYTEVVCSTLRGGIELTGVGQRSVATLLVTRWTAHTHRLPAADIATFTVRYADHITQDTRSKCPQVQHGSQRSRVKGAVVCIDIPWTVYCLALNYRYVHLESDREELLKSAGHAAQKREQHAPEGAGRQK